MEKEEKSTLSDRALEQITGGSPKGSGFNGEFVRLPSIYREKLSAPMPPEAIKQHPTKSYLSTIKAIYITERLNSVFGISGWDFEHNIVGIYDNTIGDKKIPNAVCEGRIYIREFDLYTPIQYGGGDIDGKGVDPADGFKSAVTDCLGKCASILEVGIQVFKGKPQSQDRNKSMRKDPVKKAPPTEETDANPQGMLKPQYEPILEPETEEKEPAEPIDPEREDLRNRHKVLFGKYPSPNIKIEKLRERVEAKEAEEEQPPAQPQEQPVEKELPSFEPLMEDEEEEFDEVEQMPDKEESQLDGALRQVNEFIDPDALKEQAADLVFDLEMNGGSSEDIHKLKEAVNNQYKKLTS